MNSDSRKHDSVKPDYYLGPPQKRWRDHFTQWVIGILAVFLFMPAITLADGSNAIYGAIYDTDGTPLAGVNVQVDDDNKAVTDNDGKWEITNLSAGGYNVVASKKAYTFTSPNVTLDNQELRTEVRITVGPQGPDNHTIYGAIFDNDGTPLVGVNVQVDDNYKAISDADGKWEISELSAGVYNVTASKKAYTFTSPEVTLDAQEFRTEVIITVGPQGSDNHIIYGTVYDNDGTPLVGVNVQVDDDNKAVTNVDGKWEIADLLAGDYNVVASKKLYTFEYAPPEVTLNDDNSRVEVKITVRPPQPVEYTVHGTITDADGNVLANVNVQVDSDNKAVTGDDGKWEITDLLEGEYTLTASQDGYTFEPNQVKVNLTGDETSFQVAFAATKNVVVGCGGITEGLVACYPFDGNANDASGNGNNGTEHGGFSYVTGKIGQAAQFDGIDDYVEIANSAELELNRYVTISYLIAPQKSSRAIPVVIKNSHTGNNYSSWINGDLSIVSFQQYPQGSAPKHTFWVDFAAIEGEFIHVVTVRNDSSVRIYVNGTLILKNVADYDAKMKKASLFIGYDGGYGYRTFKGLIDDVRIYNRALSDVEVREICSSAGEICSPGEYAVYGTIRDELGNKLSGVEVQAAGQTVTTDAAGNWEVSKLQEGEYTVTASKEGYTFAPENVELGNDEYRYEVVIKPLSKLKVKVVAEPRTVKQGDNVTYLVTVINGGNETATGVVLTDVLPANAGGLISIEALDGGQCDAATVTCTLPDLTTGNSARIKLVVSNTQTKSLLNTATVTANEYPADVQKTRTRVIPHLAASITDSPDPLPLPLPGEERMLHYDVAATLSANAPSAATGVKLVMTLPKGVELQAVNSDFGMCDVSNMPTLTCSMTDLSVDSPDDISHVTVGIDVALKDAGLLALTLEAKLSANEYPVHTDKERTKIFIDPEYKVGLVFIIDDSGSMQGEINQVKNAMNKFIAEIESSETPPLSVLLTFGDQVKYRAVTQDMAQLRDAIAKVKASGGGTCPEASFEAISFAIPHLKEGGTIMFGTDASPYEGSDVDGMIARLNSNGIRFNAMVFGDCANPESWNQLDAE